MNEIAVPPSTTDDTGVGQEVSWPLRHITLAGLHWPARSEAKGQVTKFLTHGWLDNSQTFSRIAPELADAGDLYAVDLAGHGQSGHRPGGQGYLLMDYVADLAELLEGHFLATDSTSVDLIGHSLGGIVSLLYAAAFPEHVRKLVMIDSLGPLSRPPEQVIGQLRKSIKKRLAGSGKQVVYPDLETAARARSGGLSPLSSDAALALVARNMQAVEGGYSWRTDSRLRHPSSLMLDEAQVEACLGQVPTESLLIRASDGLLANHGNWERRLSAFPDLRQVTVPGGHHCHLDGDTGPVIQAIRDFLGYGK